MIGFVLICFFAFAASSPDVAPRFSLLEERSTDGSPSVSITFPDGYTDTLVLTRYFGSEEDRMANEDNCIFLGYLAIELEACVAMTGCPGTEDVDFTILSSHSVDHMFKWRMDGSVEAIENPFKNGSKSEAVEIRANKGDEWVEYGDEVINPKMEVEEIGIEEFCWFGWFGFCDDSIPETNLLKVKVGYDDTFLSKVGSAGKIKSYLDQAFAHVQTYYCHNSLGTKIQIQRVGGYKHYAGKKLKADNQKMDEMHPITRRDLGEADLMVYMGTDTLLTGVVGIASTGAACSTDPGARQSINEWMPSNQQAAAIIAHEIGHNLGMRHDFDPPHKPKGCDGTGIMSYNSNKPMQWSACSKADLEAHYRYIKNNWLTWLPSAPKACGGSSWGRR